MPVLLYPTENLKFEPYRCSKDAFPDGIDITKAIYSSYRRLGLRSAESNFG